MRKHAFQVAKARLARENPPGAEVEDEVSVGDGVIHAIPTGCFCPE
jgi:hypothetical protein